MDDPGTPWRSGDRCPARPDLSLIRHSWPSKAMPQMYDDILSTFTTVDGPGALDTSSPVSLQLK